MALACSVLPGVSASTLFTKALMNQQQTFIGARRHQALDATGMSILGLGNHGAQQFGGNLRHSMFDWMSGMNYRDQVMSAMNRGGANLAMDTMGMRRRMLTRMAVPGLMGLGMMSNAMLGENNIVGKASRLGVGMGIHGAIGTGLAYKTHPAIGGAYLGMSAFNAIRSGDQFGPF
jgi:hypothetical protein